MSADTGQRFIKRNRPPRVQISYENPYDAQKKVELPFVMGVMADLSGNASEVAKPSVADRRFAEVDMDNIEKYMKSVEPAASFVVPNKLSGDGDEKMSVKLTFRNMDDFSPGGVARQVPALKVLLEAREQLANLQRYMDGKVAAESQLRKLLSDPALMEALDKRRLEESQGGADSAAQPDGDSAGDDK
jgi:type VI secretion system protein ImpB